MERKIDVVEGFDGNKVVFIHDIRFKGKRSVDWSDVEEYLKQYVGEVYCVEETKDLIYIGAELPDEYTHSKYTKTLKGANAKAKANAAQGIPELIEIASNKSHTENEKKKHSRNAKYGWFRFDARFALPVFSENGEIERYNVFHALMIVRHDRDGKMYLYDIMNIKKETSNLFGSEDLTQ